MAQKSGEKALKSGEYAEVTASGTFPKGEPRRTVTMKQGDTLPATSKPGRVYKHL